MKRKLIIFDIDGTLLYSNKIDSQCFADTYEKVYKKPFPTIDWTKYPHVTDDTIFKTVIQEQFGRVASFEEMDAFRNEFVELIKQKRIETPNKFKAIKNSRKIIELLVADDSYKVGIATGGWRKPAMVKLNHIGILTKQLHMSFADGNPTREDIINGVFQQTNALDLEFEKVVYVGDAVWDVTTTRNMNLPFIGVRREGDFEVLRKIGAETIISDYSDIDIFKRAIEEARVPQTMMT